MNYHFATEFATVSLLVLNGYPVLATFQSISMLFTTFVIFTVKRELDQNYTRR